ncbi:MAG: aromatic ring-hydroxylating dioxygenase subunit alpha [Myxococcota bacterium]
MTLEDSLRRVCAASAGEARALPFAAYTDPDLHARERERIFAREWIALGSAAALSEPGDTLTVTLGNEPVIVVRGEDGELRALSNVCRHRGTPLLDEGIGHASSLVCPYHAWGYGLDGRLKGVPHPGDVVVDKAAHALPSYRVETWAGVVFVNLDPQAPPLAERVAGIDARLSRYALDRFTHPTRISLHAWDANWKLAVENGIESYHLFRVHPETLEPYTPTRGAFYLEGSAEATLTAGTTKLARAAHPGDSEGLGAWEREHYVLVSLPPSFVGILTADSWGWISVLPSGPEQCTVLGAGLSPVATEEGAGSEFFEAFLAEDQAICERNQRGMRSAQEGGQLVELERVVVDFHQYLGNRLFGTPTDPPFSVERDSAEPDASPPQATPKTAASAPASVDVAPKRRSLAKPWSIATLCVLVATTLAGWSWPWGLLFLFWTLRSLRDGITQLVEPVARAENPALFWSINAVWALGSMALIAFDLWRWLGPAGPV